MPYQTTSHSNCIKQFAVIICRIIATGMKWLHYEVVENKMDSRPESFGTTACTGVIKIKHGRFYPKSSMHGIR